MPQLMQGVKPHGRLIRVAVSVYIVAASLTAVSAVGTGVLLTGIGGALFLASDDARNIRGQEIVVDGGYTIR